MNPDNASSLAVSGTGESTPPQENQPWFISDDLAISQAAVSSALVTVFRGKFCDAILPNRKATAFERNEVLYEIGGQDRTFFFLQAGFVKVGTITSEGRELIYDVRSGKDVVGELCVSAAGSVFAASRRSWACTGRSLRAGQHAGHRPYSWTSCENVTETGDEDWQAVWYGG